MPTIKTTKNIKIARKQCRNSKVSYATFRNAIRIRRQNMQNDAITFVNDVRMADKIDQSF